MDLHQLYQSVGNLPHYPVEQWNPAFCGDIPITITRDGQWLYLNSPIPRMEMVRLFAALLHADAGQYYLTTPVEKVRIQVEDAPFVVNDFQWLPTDGNRQQLQVVTTIGQTYLISPEYPFKLQPEPTTGNLLPYLQLARGLTAKPSRAMYYQLAEQVERQLLSDGQWGYVLTQANMEIVWGLAD